MIKLLEERAAVVFLVRAIVLSTLLIVVVIRDPTMLPGSMGMQAGLAAKAAIGYMTRNKTPQASGSNAMLNTGGFLFARG